jgi:small subunit ribosomal protein S16
MPVRLRLQRHGRKSRPFYYVVAADSRSPRDGKFIERIGSYDPTSQPATILLDVNAAVRWLQNGAEPTDTARAILGYKGALYKNHLLNGVRKGAFDQAEAERRFTLWMAEKESKVTGHSDNIRKAKDAARADALAAERAVNEKRAQEAAALIAAAEVVEEEVAPEVEATPEVEVTSEAESTPEATTEGEAQTTAEA